MPRGKPALARTDDDAIGNPITQETSRDVWQRWREDRERRQVQRTINQEIEAREAANLPIYPRECAERIADETRAVAPDWRHMRPTLGPAWGRLLKAQPELAREVTEQREAMITAVFNAAPRQLRPCVTDLRLLIDLLLIAHEAAAYQVGFEAGKRFATEAKPRAEKGKRWINGQRVEQPGDSRLTLG